MHQFITPLCVYPTYDAYILPPSLSLSSNNSSPSLTLFLIPHPDHLPFNVPRSRCVTALLGQLIVSFVQYVPPVAHRCGFSHLSTHSYLRHSLLVPGIACSYHSSSVDLDVRWIGDGLCCLSLQIFSDNPIVNRKLRRKTIPLGASAPIVFRFGD